MRTPRIVIDGSTAQRGGGFTYLVNVLPELVALAPGLRFRVMLRNPTLAASLPEAANLELDMLPPASWPGAFHFVYRRAVARSAEWGADLYFSTAEWAPLSAPFPMIASFRNPNAFSQYDHAWPLHQRVRLATLRTLAGLSASRCARILFVSEDSARWIGERMGVPPERRSVVHHGVDLATWAERSAAPRPIEAAYWLSVSSIYRYKNFVRLIEAWKEAAAREPSLADLVIVGDPHDRQHARQMHQAREASGPLAGRIHLLGEVPYAQVRAYYAHARGFLFPSYLETFGHPLVEAMASGLPILAADTAVFREIAGDGVAYADPHDTAALRDGLLELERDPVRRDALGRAAQARAQQFSWRRSAERLLELFESTLSGPESSPR